MSVRIIVLLLVTWSAGSSAAAPFVIYGESSVHRTSDLVRGEVVSRRVAGHRGSMGAVNDAAAKGQPDAGQWAALAHIGQALPLGESGTLDPGAVFNPATVDGQGRAAFVAGVSGSPRNQGVFYSDAGDLKLIAMGCGAGGGSGSTATCGDPTPVGGTFSGLFQGTVFAPAVNDAGDVLFYSDVAGGSSIRGLFLYRAATDDIIKIAAVGDPSPLGGNLSAIGPGSMNNRGRIVFLASTGGNGAQGSDVLLWKDGVISKYVAAGDPAPGNQSFLHIGTDAGGYADGTFIPDGPVPAINDNNEIAFYASTGSVEGHMLSRDGVHDWQIREGDPAPGGGYYFDLRGAPVLNGHGKIAFNAYTSDRPDGPITGGGWFVGSAGHYRRAIGFYDQLLDGELLGLAFSRNPFRPLDDGGNLILWASRQLADNSFRETLVLARADGGVDVIASQGDPAPLGGQWRYFNPWMTTNNAFQIQFGAESSDGGRFDAQFIATHFVDGIFGYGFESGL